MSPDRSSRCWADKTSPKASITQADLNIASTTAAAGQDPIMAPPRQSTILQVLTYLFGVCLFSIAFLVFLNSSISFVITDILGQKTGVGEAAGNLGFADELVAILACPLWGILSDRLGVRLVSVPGIDRKSSLIIEVTGTGYLLVGMALIVFVQAHNVYPQLLMARMFFAVGAAACTTMVTAVLPSIASASISRVPENKQTASQSTPSYLTSNESEHDIETVETRSVWYRPSGPRLAGIVGAFTGCGALVALTCFLPLPSLLQRNLDADDALRYTYYVVGAVAFIVSLVCFFGLSNLPGQDNKGWRNLWTKKSRLESQSQQFLPYWKLFYQSILAGSQPDIGLGYTGGLVARASSVGITLFIPLLVNHHFISRGLCNIDDNTLVKIECREAYIVASILTGTSQLVALLLAPFFGYFSDRMHKLHIPLLLAALSGILGYAGLAFAVDNPDPKQEGGSYVIYLWISLIGASQIGAIVCSLGSISKGVSEVTASGTISTGSSEEESLLDTSSRSSLMHLQGSIAGTYSLVGAAGILFLTKVGGALFDRSVAAPFIILMMFNVILLIAVLANGLVAFRRERQTLQHT